MSTIPSSGVKDHSLFISKFGFYVVIMIEIFELATNLIADTPEVKTEKLENIAVRLPENSVNYTLTPIGHPNANQIENKV